VLIRHHCRGHGHANLDLSPVRRAGL